MRRIPRDIPVAMKDLGIIPEKDNGEEVYALCPGHYRRLGRNDRKADNWSVNKDTGNHNCLGAETLVQTWDGLRPIAELAGMTVKLLTPRGWVEAPVKEYGKQRLWEITLRRNGVQRTIRATAAHRWKVMVSTREGSRKQVERTTQELLPGQRMSTVVPRRSGTLQPSPWGIAHGIVFGDGTKTRQACRVTLFGAKDAALLKFFPLSPTRAVQTPNGVAGIVVDGLPRAWKELPSLEEHSGYLFGWLAGYFAADGCVTETGLPMLASASREVLEFVETLCARIGVVAYGIREQTRLGLGAVPSKLFHLTFARSTLTSEFFLIEQHRARWLQGRSTYERLGWVVESVHATDVVEMVYCAEVVDQHVFALAGQLLTGNCFSCGYNGTFLDLVIDVGEMDVWSALRWIRRHGVRIVESADLPDYREVLPEPEERKRKQEVNEASLALFWRPPEARLATRNITPAAAELYDVLWDGEHHGWVVPIRSHEGTLIGWQFKNEHWFDNYPIGVEKGECVLGLELLYPGCIAMLIESPLDCPRTYAAIGDHFPDVIPVSGYGAEVTDVQMRHILSRTDRIMYALDNDKPGWKLTQALAMGEQKRGEITRRGWAARFKECLVYNYGETEAKDQGEQTDDEVLWSVEHAFPVNAMRWGPVRRKDFDNGDTGRDEQAPKRRSAAAQRLAGGAADRRTRAGTTSAVRPDRRAAPDRQHRAGGGGRGR